MGDKSILIIDDDQLDRKSYCRALKQSENWVDAEIYQASSFSEGESLCRTVKPACVLLDYRLPDISVDDVFSKIGELAQSETAVILINWAGR